MDTQANNMRRTAQWIKAPFRFLGRLIQAFMNLFAAFVLIVLLTAVLFAAYQGQQPVTVADGTAPTWQVVRAHVTDMARWGNTCRLMWGMAVTQFAPMPLGAFQAMQKQGREITPEVVVHVLGQSWEMIAYAYPDGGTLDPATGERRFSCYIRPPQFRTMAALEASPWPWEITQPTTP